MRIVHWKNLDGVVMYQDSDQPSDKRQPRSTQYLGIRRNHSDILQLVIHLQLRARWQNRIIAHNLNELTISY